MGGKGSGKTGTKYFFDPGVKRRPPITWKEKGIKEMDGKEIRNAVRYLIEGWQAALSDELLYPYCGLDAERIEELERRDPMLRSFREGAAERLVAQARVNVAKEIYEGGIKDSRWLLEKVDNEFRGGQNVVAVPVAEKQKLIQSEIADIVEGIKVEVKDESTESIT